jgi:hypothetical protein
MFSSGIRPFFGMVTVVSPSFNSVASVVLTCNSWNRDYPGMSANLDDAASLERSVYVVVRFESGPFPPSVWTLAGLPPP